MEVSIWIIIICASSAWVYWDASAHKIGKIEGEGGMLNMSAGAWGAVTLGLWIVGFPAYLISRSRLIAKAEEHPRESIFKKGGIVILAVFMLAGIYVTTPGLLVGIPNCDHGEVVALTERLVADNPAIIALAAQQPGTRASISEHAEVSYDSETEIRRCSAVLRVPPLEERVFFEIRWTNEATGEIWVEFTN
ncbi:MAG: hypothetical protein QNI99_21085 [Woeseiaceae bacterium]|nr:hypothetical protein [Woeseiaceae bacterium]